MNCVAETIPESFEPNQGTLNNRHILVTGAASEIGRALCLKIADCGGTVLMLDRVSREMNATYDEIVSAGQPEPLLIEFDQQKAATGDYQALYQGLSQSISSLDGLAHCAMWGAPLSPVVNSQDENWAKVFNQQVLRPLTLTRTLAPLLNHDNFSAVVFNVLDVGRSPRPNWGPVSAAFAGLENLAQVLSMEWVDHDTRVNTLDCGPVRTALRTQFYPGENPSSLPGPEDSRITSALVYLLSPENEHSGKMFRVAI